MKTLELLRNFFVHTGWIHRDWYYYLFADMNSRYDDQWFWRIRLVWCRGTGHRGVVWYNPGAYEPDMTCKNCGEEIG